MASTPTTVLQMAIIATATHYLVQPQPYYTYGNLAAGRAEGAFKHLSEHEATRIVTETVQTLLNKLPERFRPASRKAQEEEEEPRESDAGPGAVEVQSSGNYGESLPAVKNGVGSTETSDETSDTAPITPTSPPSSASDTFESWSASSTSSGTQFHEPSNLYGPESSYELPQPSKTELDQMLDVIHKRRRRRHEQIQRRIQRYGSAPSSPEEVPKKKGKKTVRFTLDTKPGSVSNSTKPEDKLLSPLPPSPGSELTQFSASLAVPDGSVFAHPYDFNEAELTRRLPSQMKNGAGGLAWCRGGTEQGLYMLDTPVKRLLLDLRAGVCYDGGNGRMLDVEEVMVCMLWGRGKVEEKWGGFRWQRGLNEKGR